MEETIFTKIEYGWHSMKFVELVSRASLYIIYYYFLLFANVLLNVTRRTKRDLLYGFSLVRKYVCIRL